MFKAPFLLIMAIREVALEKDVLTGIAIPSLIIFVIAAFVNAITAGEKFYCEGGLIIGSAVGIYRFIKMKAQMQQIAGQVKGKPGSRSQRVRKIITVYFINFLLMIILMVIMAIKNVWLFVGYIEGTLLLPAGIMVYAIARTIGAVKNANKF